jgi:hypothetical protein
MSEVKLKSLAFVLNVGVVLGDVGWGWGGNAECVEIDK